MASYSCPYFVLNIVGLQVVTCILPSISSVPLQLLTWFPFHGRLHLKHHSMLHLTYPACLYISLKKREVSSASWAQRGCIFRNPQENTWCWPCDDLLSSSRRVRNFTAWNWACSSSVRNSRGLRDWQRLLAGGDRSTWLSGRVTQQQREKGD